MDKELRDTSTGTVRIGHGPAETENSRGGGVFSIGGGNGFSGGFGGSSRKRAKKRARARAEANAKRQAQAFAAAEAAAQAQLEAQAVARATAHRQHVSAQTQAWETRHAAITQHSAVRLATLPMALQAEVAAAHTVRRNEGADFALFAANKAADELSGLIARKSAELLRQEAAANAFNGQDLLSMPVSDLSAQLAALPDPEAMQLHRQAWESSYQAAQDARLLTKALEALNARLAQTRARAEAIQQRNQQIRSKQHLDEGWRRERVRESNTLSMPSSAMNAGGLVFGGGGAWNIPLGAIEWPSLEQLSDAARETAWTLGKRTFVVLAALAPNTVADGQLTPEQRRRIFEGAGVPLDRVGVREGHDLHDIADAGGTVQVEYRLRLETVADTTAVIAVGTGDGIPDQVPVRHAVLDPVSNTYRVDNQNPTDKHLVFTANAVSDRVPGPSTAAPGLVALEPVPQPIPAGVDLRFNDCIVCVPGRAPFYFSSSVPPVGQGMAHGTGQPASAYWWETASQPNGMAVPEQVAAQLGGREFESFAAFETALWRAVAYERPLTALLKEMNQRSVQSGYAPYAPPKDWVGDRWRYEVRYPEDVAQGTDPFDLDRIRIQLPSASQGIWSVEALAPWIVAGAPAALAIASAIAQAGAGSRNWTPLAPPGSQALGPTTLPIEPALPGIYAGGATDPAVSEIETLPGLEEGEIGASIPGYGEGVDLPSSGLVFADPLEVGPYDELARRSVKDGLDIDHIPSRKAMEMYIRRQNPDITPRQLASLLSKAPCIAIPTEVHRKLSETYGGRNTQAKQYEDSLDIEAAVNSNFDAIQTGLLDYGLSETDIERAREKLHELHQQEGW